MQQRASEAASSDAGAPRALTKMLGGAAPESPEARFAEARAAKGAIAGAADAAVARARAAECYERFAQDFPDLGGMTAEAYFRAAELRRASGEYERALELLDKAVRVVEPGEFASRAHYEAGHVLRRGGRLAEALLEFEAAERQPDGTRRGRELAAYWHARCLREQGRVGAAETELRTLARRQVSPTDRLRTYDELVLLLTEQGRVAGAVGYFAEAKRSVESEARQATELGEAVRRALDAMKCLEALRAKIREQF